MDHLLFILCLIWIAGSPRRILATITGFTLAHSVTLAMSALDLIRVPVPPVEAAIALSVVFLATEVAKGRRNNLTWRYPIAVSGSFGLLHGLGFAAVLNEIGLPQTELVTGLLFFNVGVEIGQALFAALVIAALFLVRRAAVLRMSEEVLNTRLRYVMSYGVGCTASYWLVGRVAGLLDTVPV
jgi:hydrogenase/urease accessory protein HupE